MTNRPFIIGIAGPSCSGKTTLARGLVEILCQDTALLVPMDSYYRDLSSLDMAARARWNFDAPEAFDIELVLTHLRALVSGKPVPLPIYDFSTHTRLAETKPIVPKPVLIVEGILTLYWDDVRALLDLSVFVDAPDKVCYARRLARDVRERGRSEASVERQYAESVRPMYERYCAPTRTYASLVVNGEGTVEHMVSAIYERIKPGITLA